MCVVFFFDALKPNLGLTVSKHSSLSLAERCPACLGEEIGYHYFWDLLGSFGIFWVCHICRVSVVSALMVHPLRKAFNLGSHAHTDGHTHWHRKTCTQVHSRHEWNSRRWKRTAKLNYIDNIECFFTHLKLEHICFPACARRSRKVLGALKWACIFLAKNKVWVKSIG